jgi:hypothetical protein
MKVGALIYLVALVPVILPLLFVLFAEKMKLVQREVRLHLWDARSGLASRLYLPWKCGSAQAVVAHLQRTSLTVSGAERLPALFVREQLHPSLVGQLLEKTCRVEWKAAPVFHFQDSPDGLLVGL